MDDYTYQLRVGCFCPVVDGKVRVQDGQVVAVGGWPGVDRPLTGFADASPTIDGVFTQLALAMKGADDVDVEYDQQTGVPTSIQVDWAKNAVDDEIGYQISDFQPQETG